MQPLCRQSISAMIKTSDSSHPSQRGNVVIVDDNPVSYKVLEKYLTEEGFGVYTCHTLNELMELEHKNLKLIFIDISVDSGNGLQVVELVRQTPIGKTIPIIVCSDIPSTDDIIRGLNAGANDYILRPFTSRELLNRINALLRAQKR